MKTIKYDDNMKVVCPVCHKVILEDKEDKPDYFHPCPHIKLSYNSVDGSIIFAHSKFKDHLDGDEETFLKVARKNKMIIVKYEGDYIGGDCWPVDLIAFKK